MKKILLLAGLFLTGITLPLTALAQQPAAVAPAAPVAAAASDSLIQATTAQTAATHSLVDSLRNQLSLVQQSNAELSSRIEQVAHDPSFNLPDEAWASIITLICLTALVLIVFIVCKLVYKNRSRRFELEKMCIERGEQLSVPVNRESPSTHFTKFLLLFASCVEVTLLLNLIGGHRFFPFVGIVMAAVALGFGIVYLYRAYIERADRDENKA